MWENELIRNTWGEGCGGVGAPEDDHMWFWAKPGALINRYLFPADIYMLVFTLNTVSRVSLRPLSDNSGILNLCGSVYDFWCACQFLCRVSYFSVCLITFDYRLNIISEERCLEVIWSLGRQYIPSERTVLVTKYACLCQVTRGTIRMGPAESKFKA